MLARYTVGEPTGAVISAFPTFEYGYRFDYRNRLCSNYLHSRSAVVTEPLHPDESQRSPLQTVPSHLRHRSHFPKAPAISACAGMTQSK
jgi:hypothetical protein